MYFLLILSLYFAKLTMQERENSSGYIIFIIKLLFLENIKVA